MTSKKENGKVTITFPKEVELAVKRIFESNAPVRSGALVQNMRVESDLGTFRIVVDIHYMPYTEEMWISDQWRGRQNPNEAWFKKSNEQAMQFLTRLYGKEFNRVS